MAGTIEDELQVYFSALSKPVQKTIEWWIQTDQEDRSIPPFDGMGMPTPLFEMAKEYRKQFKRSLPKPGGKKAPSHVGIELKEIRKAFGRLQTVLGEDMSWEAREFLRGFGGHHLIRPWIPYPAVTSMLDAREIVESGTKFDELTEVITFLDSLPAPKKRNPPHSFLIRWTAVCLQRGKKPRSHVLPIAKAIHEWAAKVKDPLGKDWGDPLLNKWWPL